MSEGTQRSSALASDGRQAKACLNEDLGIHEKQRLRCKQANNVKEGSENAKKR